MLREDLSHIVTCAVTCLIASGELPEAVRGPIEILDTKQPEHGDYACNFALAAAKKAGMNPRELAEKLRAKILAVDEAGVDDPDAAARKMVAEGSPVHGDRRPALIHAIEIAGPGFLNLRLKPEAVAAYLSQVLEDAGILRKTRIENRKSVNVEFVSVNPNGPITVGSARGAAFGDTLCRVLESSGHQVNREYYINDGVNSEQMRQFAASIRSYLLLRIYGEYSNSSETDFSIPDCLELLDLFAAKRGESLASASPAEIFDEYLRFARASSGNVPTGLIAIQNAAEFDFYRHDRPGHLKRFLAETWTTGAYLSPIQSIYKIHYKGDYVFRIVQKLVDHLSDTTPDNLNEWEGAVWEDEQLHNLQKLCEKEMSASQRTDLHTFGVVFNTWFSEQSLHDSGEVERCVGEMIDKGAADEEPYRVVLKMARGGVIEEVKKEPQTETMESEELLEGEVTGTAGVSPANSEPVTSATLWLRSTKFGDDMDRVLRRRDGRLTYIASDVAYHKDKFNRPPNADKLITILGPDHHGYIHRLQAVLAALLEDDGGHRGDGGEPLSELDAQIYKSAGERDACKSALEEARRKLEVVIFQIVRFVKDGKPAPMRKRDGNIYELRDLISELGQSVAAKATKEEQQRIGVDVARFFYLMRSHDTHMDFDIDLATKQSDDNPVFYVQYAYARICSVLRKAGEARIGGLEDWRIGSPIPILQSFNSSILVHPREQSLIKKILDLPQEIQRCGEDYGVHRLTTYAIELARTYHHFYDACRVIQAEHMELSQARLALCEATRQTLKTTLDLLGVSAPERMDREEPTA